MSPLKPLLLSALVATSALLAGCSHHHYHDRYRDCDEYGHYRPARYEGGPRYIVNDRGYYERHDYWRRCD